MDRRIKAQAAIEFTILIGGIFLAFLIFLQIIAGQYIEIGDNRRYAALKDTAEAIQSEMFIAGSSKDGYKRQFAIPSKIGDADYTIILSNNELSLKTDKYQYTVNIPNSTGLLHKGTNQIRKVNGIITLN
jgi:hypothetical protein